MTSGAHEYRQRGQSISSNERKTCSGCSSSWFSPSERCVSPSQPKQREEERGRPAGAVSDGEEERKENLQGGETHDKTKARGRSLLCQAGVTPGKLNPNHVLPHSDHGQDMAQSGFDHRNLPFTRVEPVELHQGPWRGWETQAWRSHFSPKKNPFYCRFRLAHTGFGRNWVCPYLQIS